MKNLYGRNRSELESACLGTQHSAFNIEKPVHVCFNQRKVQVTNLFN